MDARGTEIAIASPSDPVHPTHRGALLPSITIGTGLMGVAAAATLSAVAAMIEKHYVRMPFGAGVLLPIVEAYSALFLSIVLPAFACQAWRNASVSRLAAQVALTSTLVLSLDWNEFFFLSEATLIPIRFGVLVALPLISLRLARQCATHVHDLRTIENLTWLLVDSFFGFLLAYLVVYKDYIPK